MKKLFAILAFAVGAAYAATPHHVYFEPDFSWNLSHSFKNEEGDFKTWGQFVGFNGGYEYSKPDFFYAAFDTYLSLGNRFWKRSNGEDVTYQYRQSRNKIEGVFGYHFASSELSLIPFLGTGVYYLANSGYRSAVAYIPIGLKLAYQFSSVNVGVRAEQLNYLQYWSRYDGVSSSGNLLGDSGYEIALPLFFKTEGAQWNASIEPYYLKFFSASFVGARISAVHDFYPTQEGSSSGAPLMPPAALISQQPAHKFLPTTRHKTSDRAHRRGILFYHQ